MTAPGGGFFLGSAYGRILLDTSGVATAISGARGIISSGLSSIGNDMQRLGAQLQPLTAPIVAFGISGIKVASNFETLMKQIELFGGVTGDQLTKVGDYVQKLGADTVFSAQDAGEALLDMLKRGIPLQNAMKDLTEISNLATAGNLSLAEATTIVTGAMSMFGAKAGTAKDVTNTFTKYANASAADIADLGQAMTTVGSVAAQYGLDLDQTSAVLGVFANRNIKGAEAGTQLKSVLLNMNRPSDDVRSALKKLGVSLYDSNGKARNFNSVILDLGKGLDKLPVQEQNELMVTLGGSYGIVGLSALRAAGGIGEMQSAAAKSPDAINVAASAADTFAFSMDSLGGSVEALQTQALMPLLKETLKPLVNEIIRIVNSITDWIRNNPEVANTIVMIVGAVAGLTALLLPMGAIISAVGAAFAAITSPITLVVGGIAALVAAFATDFMGIRTNILEPFLQWVGTVWESVRPGLEALRGWFVDTALPAIGRGLDVFNNTIVPAAIAILKKLWDDVRPALETLRAWFVDTALPAITTAINTFKDVILPAAIAGLKKLWDDVRPALEALGKWFTETALPAITTAINTFKDVILPAVINALTSIWSTVSPALESLRAWFIDSALPAIGGALTSFKENILNPVIETLGNWWNTVKDAFGLIFDWFTVSGLPKIGEMLRDVYKNWLKPFFDLLAGWWDGIKNGLVKYVDWMRDAFAIVGDKYIKPVLDIVNSFFGAVDNAIKKAKEFLHIQDEAKNVQVGELQVPGQGMQNSVLPSLRDNGGFGQSGMPYAIGKGAQPELFIPRTNGTFIPNIDKVLAAAGGNGGGNVTFAAGAVVIHANSPVEGMKAADAFAARLTELIGRKG